MYIGAFWLAFSPILHHCFPQQGQLPMTPRKLCETAKCKCNIGQILQHLASALHLEAEDIRGCRRECKEEKKGKNSALTMLKLVSLFLLSFSYLF